MTGQKVLHIFFFPILVFLLHAAAMIFLDVYRYFPSFDIPMHFLGGLVIAISLSLLLNEFQKNKYIGKLKPLARITIVVCGTVTIAVLWEFHEFLLDQWLGTATQAGIADTMGDLALGMLGGAVGAVLKMKQ